MPAQSPRLAATVERAPLHPRGQISASVSRRGAPRGPRGQTTAPGVERATARGVPCEPEMELALSTDGPLATLRVLGAVKMADTSMLADYLRVARENGAIR